MNTSHLTGVALPEKGGYVLLIGMPEEREIVVGKLKKMDFGAGYYAYVGSALGGIRSRLTRHLKRDKKLHWHIDYLLQQAFVEDIIVCETEERIECDIARAVSRKFDVIPGFGSSDCKCSGHLFYSPSEMGRDIWDMLETLDKKPQFVRSVEANA